MAKSNLKPRPLSQNLEDQLSAEVANQSPQSPNPEDNIKNLDRKNAAHRLLGLTRGTASALAPLLNEASLTGSVDELEGPFVDAYVAADRAAAKDLLPPPSTRSSSNRLSNILPGSRGRREKNNANEGNKEKLEQVAHISEEQARAMWALVSPYVRQDKSRSTKSANASGTDADEVVWTLDEQAFQDDIGEKVNLLLAGDTESLQDDPLLRALELEFEKVQPQIQMAIEQHLAANRVGNKLLRDRITAVFSRKDTVLGILAIFGAGISASSMARLLPALVAAAEGPNHQEISTALANNAELAGVLIFIITLIGLHSAQFGFLRDLFKRKFHREKGPVSRGQRTSRILTVIALGGVLGFTELVGNLFSQVVNEAQGIALQNTVRQTIVATHEGEAQVGAFVNGGITEERAKAQGQIDAYLQQELASGRGPAAISKTALTIGIPATIDELRGLKVDGKGAKVRDAAVAILQAHYDKLPDERAKALAAQGLSTGVGSIQSEVVEEVKNWVEMLEQTLNSMLKGGPEPLSAGGLQALSAGEPFKGQGEIIPPAIKNTIPRLQEDRGEIVASFTIMTGRIEAATKEMKAMVGSYKALGVALGNSANAGYGRELAVNFDMDFPMPNLSAIIKQLEASVPQASAINPLHAFDIVYEEEPGYALFLGAIGAFIAFLAIAASLFKFTGTIRKLGRLPDDFALQQQAQLQNLVHPIVQVFAQFFESPKFQALMPAVQLPTAAQIQQAYIQVLGYHYPESFPEAQRPQGMHGAMRRFGHRVNFDIRNDHARQMEGFETSVRATIDEQTGMVDGDIATDLIAELFPKEGGALAVHHKQLELDHAAVEHARDTDPSGREQKNGLIRNLMRDLQNTERLADSFFISATTKPIQRKVPELATRGAFLAYQQSVRDQLEVIRTAFEEIQANTDASVAEINVVRDQHGPMLEVITTRMRTIAGSVGLSIT